MTYTILNPKEFNTTEKIIPGSFLQNSPAASHQQIRVQFDNWVTSTLSIAIENPSHSHKAEVVEANDEEIKALFLQIEPGYAITNRMLADL